MNKQIENIFEQVEAEYLRARSKFYMFNSAHEGYAVILEELDELWDSVKANDISHAKKEAIQVMTMAMAFILEVQRPEQVQRKQEIAP